MQYADSWRHTLLPDGTLLLVWTVVMTVIGAVVAAVTPLHIAFEHTSIPLWIFLYVLDGIALFHVWVGLIFISYIHSFIDQNWSCINVNKLLKIFRNFLLKDLSPVTSTYITHLFFASQDQLTSEKAIWLSKACLKLSVCRILLDLIWSAVQTIPLTRRCNLYTAAAAAYE